MKRWLFIIDLSVIDVLGEAHGLALALSDVL